MENRYGGLGVQKYPVRVNAAVCGLC